MSMHACMSIIVRGENVLSWPPTGWNPAVCMPSATNDDRIMKTKVHSYILYIEDKEPCMVTR